MTRRVVRCVDCSRVDGGAGPREWTQNCDECCADFLAFHKAETGHTAEIRVYETVSTRELQEKAMTHPVWGPCGCHLWTPPPTRRESARALITLLLLFNTAEAALLLYSITHPGW